MKDYIVEQNVQNAPTINNVCVPIESLRKKVILFSKGMHAVLERHSVLRLQVAGTGLADQVQQQHLVCSSPLGHFLESHTFKSGLLLCFLRIGLLKSASAEHLI